MLMFASAMTFVYRARPAARNVENSAGVLPTAVAPILDVNSRSGPLRAAFAAALASLSTMSLGVSTGASSPAHAVPSNAGTPTSLNCGRDAAGRGHKAASLEQSDWRTQLDQQSLANNCVQKFPARPMPMSVIEGLMMFLQ